MQKYGEIIESLSSVLNSDYRSKEDKELFKQCLTELKEDYKTEISTKFLKQFITKDLEGIRKSVFIRDFLKGMGLKTFKRYRGFSVWENQTSHIYKTEYIINKKGDVVENSNIYQEIGKLVKDFKEEVLYFIKGF